MATYYIATTGNDTTGNGTEATPWLTISKAYTGSTAGDTIVMAAGTYTWATATMTNRTLQGASATTTFIAGASTNGQKTWTLGGTFTVNDVTFTTNGRNDGTAYNTGLIGTNSTSSTLTFARCIFTNLSIGGTFFNGSNLGASSIFGLGVGGTASSIILDGCLVHGIVHNVGTSVSGVFSTHQGSGTGTSSVTCRNSTFYFGATGSYRVTHFEGLYLGLAPTITLTNCIVQNDSGGTQTWAGGNVNPIISYSCYYLMTGTVTATNSVTSNPLLIDPDNADFRLRPDSPCIDTGTII